MDNHKEARKKDFEVFPNFFYALSPFDTGQPALERCTRVVQSTSSGRANHSRPLSIPFQYSGGRIFSFSSHAS